MKYFVNRQNYWGVEDPLVVEIAAGGCDYANADMLSDPGNVYGPLGDMLETNDPREALEAAIAIRDEWNKRLSGETCRIEHGFTGGYTIPFTSFPTDDELRKWAQETWDAIPKCDVCGEPIEEPWKLCAPYDYGDENLCSEYCADKAYYLHVEMDEEEEEENDD